MYRLLKGAKALHLVDAARISRANLVKSSFSTVTPFKLADIGEGIAEVELMKWFVKVILFFGNGLIVTKNCFRREMLSNLSIDCAKFKVTKPLLKLPADIMASFTRSITEKETSLR